MTQSGLDLSSNRPRRSLWQRIVDVALTDVAVLVRGIDAASIEALERVLLEADFGVDASLELAAELERAVRRGELRNEGDLRDRLAERILEILRDARTHAPPEGSPPPGEPTVTLLVGVNGTGKTTAAARLARRWGGEGRVLLAATDTFRSGAQAQLRVWAERVGADFVGGARGADPASVAYDAAQAARARGCRRLIVDTAGRLHTQRGLMEELRKIDRVLGRLIPEAPHARVLVVDATSGQNVLAQAREFGRAFPLHGLFLSKFDSTARGGTAVAVAREMSLPVRWLGTGESETDLEPFDPERFVRRLLSAE